MPRNLTLGQRSRVLLGGPDVDELTLVHEDRGLLLEAPNWTGNSLILNGAGRLWRLDLTDPTTVVEVIYRGLPDINNDHVVAPGGRDIYCSANDGHIYCGSLDGGEVVRVSPDDGKWHFLHGVSPDGRRLAYVELASFEDPGQLVVLALQDGSLLSLPTGSGHVDGPEWSPDGQWIYCNSEAFTSSTGHAQLVRLPDGGGLMERLVASDTVDWFPHISPDGRWASYVSFPPGTQGHPADVEVVVHIVSTDDWSTPIQSYPLPGGQGTMNVNSWAPDSSQLALVAYPVDPMVPAGLA